ncbi:MAG: ABC transporter ATP-binding protein [Thermodesulfobacteriota bacterium]
MATSGPNLLEVEHLKKYFPVRGGVFLRPVAHVRAADDLTFSIRTGETLGLVGESGCGKTTVGRCVARLYAPTAGAIRFDGTDLADVRGAALRRLRRHIQMVFQDPFESLNPRHTVGDMLEEPFKIHHIGTAPERRQSVRALLDRVGLPASAAGRFPHEFSGGQRQRIGIARAIALNPRLIICDEPVSALDVSIQSQILNLLLDLQHESGFTCLFIAHDLAVVRHVSDRIAVMYLGKIVEITDADTIYRTPLHPYTRALISAIPVPDPKSRKEKQVLSGDVPSPSAPPSGCRFHTRCPHAIDICKTGEPPLEPAPFSPSQDHQVACHRARELFQPA